MGILKTPVVTDEEKSVSTRTHSIIDAKHLKPGLASVVQFHRHSARGFKSSPVQPVASIEVTTAV